MKFSTHELRLQRQAARLGLFSLARLVGWIALFLFCLIASMRVWAVDSVDDLTGPWQLLVDDYVVANKTNVVRTYHPFQKFPGNPVLVATMPWEQLVKITGTVLPNETRTGYRTWYVNQRSNNPCGDGSTSLYATSTNGINWEKPSLGLQNQCGRKTNNLYFATLGKNGSRSVMHTPWETNPMRRYKFIGHDSGGYRASWSSNGINPIDVSSSPVFTGGSDAGHFCWDPRSTQYLGYVKMAWYDTNGLKRRAVAMTTSVNFTNWPPESLILWPDSIDDRWSSNIVQRTHHYALSVFPYETVYLGFLWIFRATNLFSSPPDAGYEGYQVGSIHTELVSSRDRVHWKREEGDRPPLLDVGAGGTWDAGMVLAARAPVVEGDTIKMWYGGFSLPHDSDEPGQSSAIGLATLRKDGFVSFDAGATTGTILTKLFGNAGGPLLLNYHTNSSTGSVRVEVLDEYNNVLPGYSQNDCVALTGNSITQAVTWGAQSQLPANRPYLRLRFLVQDASVYSFMVGSNAVPVEEPPTLGYARQGSSLILSWPTNSTGYLLRYITNAAGTNWLPALPTPVIMGGQYVVTNAMTNTEKFYRLRKP